MKRQRVTAIIIQDKKILLVRDVKADWFSLPGGTLENNEDHDAALRRELMEEISVKISDAKFYYSFDLINQTYKVPQTDHVYIVSISGTPECSSEICELGWFPITDITNNKINVPCSFYKDLCLKL